jgi:adenylate cyclase
MSLIAELSRRNVIRIAGLYLVGAWLLVQVADTVFPAFDLPGWTLRWVILLLALGFVPAMVLAWIYELTPDGIKRDTEVGVTPMAPKSARRIDRTIIVLLLLALGYLALDKFLLAPAPAPDLAAEQTPAAAGPLMPAAGGEIALAVLPFANLSTDPEQEFFSDGLSEELIRVLSPVKGLRVTARTSAFQFKGTQVGPEVIASKLGVGYLLTGSVRRAANRLRVNAELFRIADGQVLWSDTLERELSTEAIFAVQDEIARNVSRVLPLALKLGTALSSSPFGTRDLAAYEDYLRAHQEQANESPDSWRASLDRLQSAVARDPTFALAHIAIARVQTMLVDNAGDPLGPAMEAAEAALAVAAALGAEDTAPWHTARGLTETRRGNFLLASAALDRALELDPDYVPALRALSYVRLSQGDIAGRLFLTVRAAQLDPLDQAVQLNLANALLRRDDLDGAAAVCRRLHDHLPDGNHALVCDYFVRWARMEPSSALERLHRGLEMYPSQPNSLRRGAYGWLQLGDPEAAAAWARRTENAMLTEWAEGHREQALTHMRRAHELNPENVFDLLSLIEGEYALGNHSNVVALLALRFDNRSPAVPLKWVNVTLLLRYAHALQAEGRTAEAKPLLEAVLAESHYLPRRADLAYPLTAAEAFDLPPVFSTS